MARSRFFVALVVSAVTIPCSAAAIEVRFDFQASKFGGGPSDSVPISKVSGSFIVLYDPARLLGATVESFEIKPNWGNFSTDDLLIRIANADRPPRPLMVFLGVDAPEGHANSLMSIFAGSDDFLLSFEFPAYDPVFGPQSFGSFSYAGWGFGHQIYQTRNGSARATLIPTGDANGDGRVDLLDFGSLKDNFGVGTARAQGDFNRDGKVDLLDFGLLKDNFGAGAAVSVPEPGGLGLVACGAAAWAVARRRRSDADRDPWLRSTAPAAPAAS